MAAGEIPAIVWGSGYANTLHLGFPLDNAMTAPRPRSGSQWAQAPSGEEDAWLTGVDYVLMGDARWIPTSDGTTPRGDTITGWDGATGWRGMLEWLWKRNVGRWAPDKGSLGTYTTFYLVEPAGPSFSPELEEDGTKRVQLVLRSEDGTPFTGY